MAGASRGAACVMLRSAYVARNLIKNAVAAVAVPLMPGRGCLGLDGDPAAVVATLDALAQSFASLGSPLAGARVLELGPGRTPELTGALILAGAESAIGLDVRDQIDPAAARPETYGPLVTAFGTRPGEFLQAADASPASVRERWEALSAGPWPARFERYDGATLPLADRSVDLVVSKSVLEHVPVRHVPRLVAEMRRVLRPQGGMVHTIDLRDHLHVIGDHDVSGDWLEALRYPEWLFRAMFARRSTSINRLRSPQWRELIEGSGLEVRDWRQRHFALPEGFDSRALQPPWNDHDPTTLSVGMLHVAATRPA